MINSFKKSKKNYKKRNFMKINSILLVFIFVLGLVIMPPSEVAHADEISQIADEIKPIIDVQYLGTNPQEPLVGQDVEVRYQIIPQPFQHNVPKPKEIVLILDKSGSMEDNSKMKNLKSAAKEFVKSMTEIDKETNIPKATNLSIGIVAYDKHGSVKSELLQVTDGSSVNTKSVEALNKAIGNLDADGGTNIGDGLRKGAYLLDKSDIDANKAIIFMADGQPTYYSKNGKLNCKCSTDKCGKKNCDLDNICTENHGPWFNRKKCGIEDIEGLYERLDKVNPNVGGNGSSDDGKSLDYAKKIGDIIRGKNHNIFSIGYGLGKETSESNIKMKQIHESMGGVNSGENSTFFATDSGAIDSIFKKISDQLLASYPITDAQLSLNLAEGITAVNGVEVGEGNSGKIKLDPIVYKLGENNWYRADPVTITFKIKANKSGKYPMLGENSNLEYTDINGNKVSITIKESTIIVKEFTVDDKEKLQVNFYPEKNGYLLGDTVEVVAGFTHPGTEGINFTNATFDITDGLPESIELVEGNPVLEFGSIEENTPMKKYKFKVKNNTFENIDYNYMISGKYSYDVDNKGSNKVNISDTQTTMLDMKIGQVIVSIEDSDGRPINGDVKVILKNEFLDIQSTDIKNGVIKFDNIPSGNYNLKLTNIPDGYEYTDGSNAIVAVYYDKDKETNIAKYKFVLKGSAPNAEVTVEASDSSGKVDKVYNSNESNDSRYDKFIKDDFDNEYKLFGQSYADINFSGEKLNYLQYQILKSDSNPTIMPTDGWSEIAAENNGINEDIDTSEAGKLTQKAYSVSHMNGLNTPGYNPDSWKDNKIVYQHPLDGVRYVDASVAENKDEYAHKSTIIDPVTNKVEEVWVPQKVFTKTVDYTWENYKEASKTWGYFKAPEDGFYYFRTHSDDGIRFTITTKTKDDTGAIIDEPNLLVDQFEPHGPTFHRANKAVELEAGEYYPVFIEYFNVGDAAVYGVQYVVDKNSDKTPNDSEYKYVDPGSFFPSKSTAPGESSDGSFEGQGGIKFPEEEGKYYVAYRGFNKDIGKEELIKEGFYGPFIVEDRFTLERLVDSNIVNLDDDFKIKYKITPKDIRITDLYKTKEELKEGNVKEVLEIKNMYLKDTIPKGIIPNNITVESESLKSTTSIDKNNGTIDIRFGVEEGESNINPVGVEYSLIREDNEAIEKAIYKSEPIIVTLDVTTDIAKEYVFENKVGKLIYEDISLKDEKIMKESYFGETNLNVNNNKIPNIIGKLKSESKPVVNLGDNVSIEYEIIAETFKYSDVNGGSKDIVLVIDTTSKKSEEDKTMESIKEHIINDFMAKNDVNMGLVTFDETGNGIERQLTNNTKVMAGYINEIKESKNNNVGKITNAIKKADKILKSGKSTNKNMVFITFGDIVYEENEISEVKNKDYNIFTTYMSKVNGNGNKDDEINVNKLHKYLKGQDNNYINNEGNNGNELKDGIMERLKERLKGDLITQYIIKDAVLNFDLGEDLNPVSGFVNNLDSKLKVEIPEIIYDLNKDDNIFCAKEIKDINIVVKPNKVGNIKFGEVNNISYSNLLGSKVKNSIEVPIIDVIESTYDIEHGLYEGIKDGNINIMQDEEEKEIVIAGGTNVNFGATFKTKITVPKITLTVDEKYENIKNMNVYKLVDSKLVEIKGAKITTANNIYDIVLPKDIKAETDILIRYSAKLPKGKELPCVNNIKVGASEKSIKVTTTSTEEKDRLPDLF